MLAVLQYQTAVMRGDFDAANELLPSIPESEYTTVARFLESQGFKEEAMAVTTDSDHKFDLALELGHIDVAHNLLDEIPEEERDSTDTLAKWKKLSDLALKDTNLALCESASKASNDFSGLLLLYSATGNAAGMEELAKAAEEGGKTNVAFVAYLLTGNVEACADLLISTKRLPEAAFFARTYLPGRVDEIVQLWKEDLSKISESAANALAMPSENPDLFPDQAFAMQVEQMFMAQRDAVKASGVPASDYPTAKDDLDLNLIELIKARGGGGAPPPPPPAAAPPASEPVASAAVEEAPAVEAPVPVPEPEPEPAPTPSPAPSPPKPAAPAPPPPAVDESMDDDDAMFEDANAFVDSVAEEPPSPAAAAPTAAPVESPAPAPAPPATEEPKADDDDFGGDFGDDDW